MEGMGSRMVVRNNLYYVVIHSEKKGGRAEGVYGKKECHYLNVFFFITNVLLILRYFVKEN